MIAIVVAMVAVLVPATVRAATSAGGTGSTLVFATQPAGATGGEAFTTQPVVEVHDSTGAVDTTATPTVVLTLEPNAAAPGAALTCDPVDAVDGVATFTDCAIDLAANGYVLTASAEGAASQQSAGFDVVAGPAVSIAVATQPGDIAAGQPFSPVVAVELRDAGGNAVSSADRALGLIAVDPDGAPVPLTGCTGGETIDDQGAEFYSVPADGATTVPFPDCTVDRAGSGYTLLAVAVPADDASESLIGYSDAFDVTTGAADHLVFSTQPGGAMAGEALQRQPVVTVEDAHGNVVPLDEFDAIQLRADRSDITLDCGPGGAVADLVDGVATFAGCRIDAVGHSPFFTPPLPSGSFTLTAQHGSTSLEVVSADFGPGNTGDELAGLEFVTQPSDTTAGLPLSPAPSVAVSGPGGVPADDEVTFALLGGGPDAALLCVNDSAIPLDGIVTLDGCRVDVPGTYELQASADALTATSEPFTVTIGDPVTVRFDTVPTSAEAGSPFHVAATLHDAGGNRVDTSGDVVQLALAAADGGRAADIDCDGSASGATVDGLADFPACSVDEPGEYRVVATSTVGVVVSDTLVVTTGPPSSVRYLSAPTSAIDGGLLATPTVLVEDAGGNPLDTAVTLTVAGGSLSDCDVVAQSRRGIAAFPGCVLATAGSSIDLVASAGSTNPVSSTTTVPVIAGPPVGSSDADVPLEQTFGHDAHAENPTVVEHDVNPVTGALQFTTLDLEVAGIGVPFELRRTYNSFDHEGGVFGPGWSSLFDAGVRFDEDGNAIVRGEDGQRVVFTPADCGKKKRCDGFEAPPGSLVDLECKRTTCTVTRRDGVSFTSEGGRITELSARSGHGLSFSYGADDVVDEVALTTSGAPLTISVLSEDGRITGLATPTRNVGYGYDDGRLTAVADPEGRTTTYDHDGDGRLRSRTLGASQLEVAYLPDGRVSTAALRGQQRRYDDRYTYRDGGAVSSTVRHTAVIALGDETEAEHVSLHRGNVLLQEQLPEGETYAYSYDADVRPVAFQDALGRVERMRYDGAGNLLELLAADGAVERYAYDDAHRVTSVTDRRGNSYEYHYADDQLRWVVPPEPTGSQVPGSRGEVGTHFEHDAWGQLVEVKTAVSTKVIQRDEVGNEIGHQLFDPADAERLDPLNGNGPRVVHDEAGNIVESVSPRGHHDDGTVDPAHATTFTYDGSGRLLEHHTPDGTTAFTYTIAGEQASITAPATGTTIFVWNEATRTRTAGGANTGTWTFDPAGSLLDDTDDDGRTTSRVLDRSGRTLAEVDAAGFETTTLFDTMDNVVRGIDRMGEQWIDYGVHGAVRITSGTGVSTTSYDAAGSVVETVDQAGVRTTYGYDNHQNLASVATAVGTTSYEYDAFGRVVSMTAGNGNVTSYVNDAAGQRVAMILDGSTWTYDHDVDGNLVSVTDPDGRVSSYELDATGRQTAITHRQPGLPTIEITQTFDAAGRRVAMSDPTGSHVFTYDDERMTSAQSPLGTFVYDHSVAGQRTDTYPDGTAVTYRFADDGQLMGLDAPDVSVDYIRGAGGRLSGIVTGNGLLESFTYDADGVLSSRALRCGARALSTTGFGYDDRGRVQGTVQSLAGRTRTQTYGYDAHDRSAAEDLVTTGTAALPTDTCIDGTTPPPSPPAPAPPAPAAAPASVMDPPAVPTLDGFAAATGNPVGYDPVGNRTSFDSTTFSYGGKDQLVSGSDGRSAVHDGAGNMISSTVDGQTTTYDYDAAGRLVEVGLPDGRTVSYTLDGDGLRVAKAIDGADVATYHWDRRSDLPILVEEDLVGGAFRRYFYGAGPVAMQTQDGTFYLHGDGLANVSTITDRLGAVVAAYTYDAWGNSQVERAPGAPVTGLRYGGNLFDDDTGLYHLLAREYDPVMGRFTQRDPVEPAIGVPVTSRYAYAANLPTVFGDPTGRVPEMLSLKSIGQTIGSAGQNNPTSTGLAWSVRSSGGLRFFAKKGLVPTVRGLRAAKHAWKTGTIVVSQADDAARFASKASTGLAALGALLSVGLVAYNCAVGTAYECAGAAISLAFNVGCTVVSGGAATAACIVLGAAIPWLVTNYGPEMVQGTVEAATWTERSLNRAGSTSASVAGVLGVTIAVVIGGACVVMTGGLLTPLCVTGAAALGVFLWTVGGAIDAAVVSGFNDLGDAISSGWDAAIDGMISAGLGLYDAIWVMANLYAQTGAQVVARFEELGLDVVDFAAEVVDFFAPTAAQAAQFFTDLGYDILDVGRAIDTAFSDAADWSAEAFATALAGAGHAWGEISSAITTSFDLAVDGVIEAGLALGYGAEVVFQAAIDGVGLAADVAVSIANDIGLGVVHTAALLRGAYELGVAEVVALFADAGTAVEEIAAAVGEAFADLQDWGVVALADALAGAGYVAAEIARGLQAGFDATLEVTAEVLLDLQLGVGAVADALSDAYGATADAVAGAFVQLGVGVELIADALGSVYGLAAGAIVDLIGDVGGAIEELGEFFGDLGDDIADTLNPANWF